MISSSVFHFYAFGVEIEYLCTEERFQTWKHDTANDHELSNNFSNGISFNFNRLVEKANEWAEMEKAADTADTSVLFFSAGAIFLAQSAENYA